eukprot:TRINITY_DN551_c0_g1_i2.p1 TRINITY_DN551_c0_g1~~TRINITY_DN551_c0_g1_i2.p1  ORF type:complete len:1305 (-),score=225.81 TRINITY_DN551_c0_g1_i2:110-4024(-)
MRDNMMDIDGVTATLQNGVVLKNESCQEMDVDGGGGGVVDNGVKIVPIKRLEAIKDKFQLDVFVRGLQKGGRSFLKMFGRNRDPKDGSFTLDDMMMYSSEVIPCSLLRLNGEQSSKAVKMHQYVLKYCGEADRDMEQPTSILSKLLAYSCKRGELREELYMQLIRHTRGCTAQNSFKKAWEALWILCSTTPPQKEFLQVVTEYIHDVQQIAQESYSDEVKLLVDETWQSLKKITRTGPKKMVPDSEEIVAFMSGKQLTEVVYFMDGQFEQLCYLLSTTAGEAVEKIAQVIGLTNYNTFALFEWKSAVKEKGSGTENNSLQEEHILIDDSRYISDIVLEFKGGRGSRFLFKKRMFRETDENITEGTFVNLSYIQAQHDFLEGNYPVKKDDAAQMCALQIAGKYGVDLRGDDFYNCVEGFIVKQLWMSRSREEWRQEVLKQYKGLKQFSKEDAKIQFLRWLRALPYGGAIFFTVKKLEDPIGLLPGRVVLGINKRGIHFFRPVPKEYVHSAELRDIMQFGSSSQAVFFKMRVAGVLHVFQFETRHGEDICMSLQTHINDVMMKRYSKANKTTVQGLSQGGDGVVGTTSPSTGSVQFNGRYEKHIQQLSQQIDEYKDDLEQAKMKDEAQIKELDKVKELNIELSEVVKMKDGQFQEMQQQLLQLKQDNEKLRHEMEQAGQVAVQVAQGKAQVTETQLANAQNLLQSRTKDLETAEIRICELEGALGAVLGQKEVLENKMSRIEDKFSEEVRDYQQQLDQLRASERQKQKELDEKDRRITELLQQINNVVLQSNEMCLEIEELKKGQEDLEELQEFKRDYNRKEKQNASIIEQQGRKLEEFEKVYKEEQKMRKQYWNMMEDMKGKIRVYARIRPFLPNESSNMALKVPDVFTIQHKWKDTQREYVFDNIFGPQTTQEEVFEDTKQLIQSAVDGFNVCIFAYGQTGSGKTFTIQGDHQNPGLTPRGVSELFRIIQRDNSKFQFSIKCYMLELYQDTLMDLLDPPDPTSADSVDQRRFDRSTSKTSQRTPTKLTDKKIEIKSVKGLQGWVEVHGVKQVEVRCESQLLECIQCGLTSRHVAQTKMNIESSRSHLIITIIIESTNLQTQHHTKGKLSFVDLAGSERVHKSGSIDDASRLKEAQSINKSLSALGDVISALATEQSHIPYRNHKLTQLMSDSLGGVAKTLMFVNASPSVDNLDESANSLGYAQRVKSIKNKPQKNEANKYVQHLKREIDYWKEQAGLPPNAREYRDLIEITNTPCATPPPALSQRHVLFIFYFLQVRQNFFGSIICSNGCLICINVVLFVLMVV